MSPYPPPLRPLLLAALSGLVLAVASACGPTGEAQDAAPRPPVEDPAQIYAQGREALAAAGIESVSWGLTPFLAPEQVERRYRPILASLEEVTGIKTHLVVGTGYADMEERIVQSKVDIAVMSPYGYVRAHKTNSEISVFATHVANGSLSYGSYIISRLDGPVRTLPDLAGRTVGFVDPGSSSGGLFPVARMLEAGLDPRTDMKVQFLGSHSAVYDAVVDGRVDAGTTYDLALVEGRKRHPNSVPVDVIAKCERIPRDPYVARPGFPPAASQAIGHALSSISTRTKAGRRALGGMPRINGFVPADDAFYDSIRRMEDRLLSSLGTTDLSILSTEIPEEPTLSPEPLPPSSPTDAPTNERP